MATEAPAKKKPVEVEAYANDALKMVNPKKPDEEKEVDIALVLRARDTQARQDTDPGEYVDTHRVEKMTEAVTNGAKLPAIKVMVCSDAPGHKDKPVYVLWDGFHTIEAYHKAGKKKILAKIWHGSWAQALAAAAVLANTEHETNGKPKSFKDKCRSLHIYVKGLERAGVKVKEMPSNRQLALMFGISHTAVGDEDPCGRRSADSKTKDQKLAEKKAARSTTVAEAGAAHLNGQAPAAKRYEVVRRATNEVAGTFDAESPAKALEAYKLKSPGAVLTEFLTRELTTTVKPGTEKSSVGFDWQRMESDVGGVARGLDGLGDIYGIKNRSEWKTAYANLNSFNDIIRALRRELTAKKKDDAKPADPAPAEKK